MHCEDKPFTVASCFDYFVFSAVLVNETPVLPYLQAVGDLDEIELLPEGTNVRESSSNGMLSTGLPNTDTCDNPYLRPAKRLRRTLKTS